MILPLSGTVGMEMILDILSYAFEESVEQGCDDTIIHPIPMCFHLLSGSIPYHPRLANINLDGVKWDFFKLLNADFTAERPAWEELRHQETHHVIDMELEDVVEELNENTAITPIDDAVSLVSKVTDPLMEVIQTLPTLKSRSIMTLEVKGEEVPEHLRVHIQAYLVALALEERRDIVEFQLSTHLSGQDDTPGWVGMEGKIDTDTLTSADLDAMGVPSEGLATVFTYPRQEFGQQLATTLFHSTLLTHLMAYAMGKPALTSTLNITQLHINRESVDAYREPTQGIDTAPSRVRVCYNAALPAGVFATHPDDITLDFH